MAAVNVGNLRFRKNQISGSDFNAARDNSTSLSAGVPGERGELEVGEDGVAAQYDAVQLGQPQSNASGDRKGNEIYLALDDNSGSPVNDTVQFSFQVRNKGELGGGNAGNITGFISVRNQDDSDPAKRRPLPPQRPVVPDGRLLTLVTRDETQSHNVDVTGSATTIELPILGGK